MVACGPSHRRRRDAGRWLRFAGSWALALAMLGLGVPKLVGVAWNGVLPALAGLTWSAALGLVALWFVGLLVHTFVLTAAAPRLTHRRALTLNLTGSAVSNVVPLGGAAGVELNRRMMRAWGLDTRTFAGFTFLTNLWDVGAKLLLPVIAVVALGRAGIAATPSVRVASVLAGVAFVVVAAAAAVLLRSARVAAVLGGTLERCLRAGLRVIGRDRDLDLVARLADLRRECADLVARGWLRMSVGIGAYLALQGALLAWCLHLTGAGTGGAQVLAGFAVERALTVLPLTPGGIGIADLGLVGVLLALGGDPAGVTAGAVLFRVFAFAVEIPVGGGALGLWVLLRHRSSRAQARRTRLRLTRSGLGSPPAGARRIAHVTDVFLPRLGGIETHVDELARQQRARGLEAEVLTPTAAGAALEEPWVRRLPVRQGRRAVLEYDAVHVHLSMLSPYGLRLARAAIDAGIPTLVTVHSMWAGAGAILRFAARASLRRWPVVWSAVSDAAASSFRRALAADVAVLPNAVDVAAWRSSSPRPAGAADLICVMRLMPRKRPLQLVRIFAAVQRLVPEARLTIVGDGPMRPRMERAAARHGLAGAVRFTGRISREEVREELLAASLYVAPAPKESFGLAALEARCAGLPVVAHRGSGIAEFVRDRVDGILVDDDAQMTAAIADLATDRELCASIAAHNRRVAPSHDWSRVLEQTDALYDSAARLLAPPAVEGAAPTGARTVPVAGWG